MSRYSIEGSTLTAIGDAIREKTGKLTRVETEIYIETLPAMTVSKTPNATGGFDANAKDGNCPAGDFYDVVSFPGASSIKVDYGLAVHFPNIDYLQIAPGRYSAVDFPQDETEKIVKPGGASLVRDQITIENTDTITFHLYTTYEMPVMGYYAECTSFDADGNPLGGEQIEVEREVEVPNTLTPSQMAEEIEAIELGKLPDEAYNITGDCNYKFSNNGWNWFIDMYGDKLTTKDITNISNMFYYSNKLKSIPFDINVDKSAGNYDISNVFNYCQNLTEVPYLKGELNPPTSNYGSNPSIQYLFQSCHQLRYIPNDYFDQFGGDAFWAAAQTYTKNRNYNFTYCSSLRNLPTSWVRLKNKNNAYYSHLYYFAFNSCYVLDEIINIPIEPTVALTSNCFYNTFDNCNRLKNILFETNEDGSPIVVNWKSQTIVLTGDVGKSSSDTYITDYNSGITTDKKVSDDASYQALKDDPDWYTLSWDYSRYNRTSAVATINSLPDTSAGGANIIKFKGAAGALTDGGAINTMTEEEIAVATAKGWTVSLS